MGGGDEFSSIRTFYRTPDQYSSKPNVVKKRKSEKLSYCHNPKRLRRHDNWMWYGNLDDNLISGSSAFSKTSLNIWKVVVHVLLKPGLENFKHYFTSVWDECNCAVVWTFFSIAFLWDWNESWPFPVLWPLLSFSNLLAYWGKHFHGIIFKIWNSSTGIPYLH